MKISSTNNFEAETKKWKFTFSPGSISILTSFNTGCSPKLSVELTFTNFIPPACGQNGGGLQMDSNGPSLSSLVYLRTRSTLVIWVATSAVFLAPNCNTPIIMRLWETINPTSPLKADEKLYIHFLILKFYKSIESYSLIVATDNEKFVNKRQLKKKLIVEFFKCIATIWKRLCCRYW